MSIGLRHKTQHGSFFLQFEQKYVLSSDVSEVFLIGRLQIAQTNFV